jgi:hypothetical protein
VVPASSLPRVLVISDRRQDASTHHKGQGERLVWLYLRVLKTNRPEILPPDGSHKKISASQRVGGGSSVRQPGIVVKSFCAKVSILYRRNIHCTLPNGEQNPIDFIQPVSRCHEFHSV